jgi:hypothetical protein
MRFGAVVIGVGLLLSATGALGLVTEQRTTAALAQGTTSQGGMNGMGMMAGMGMMGGPFPPSSRPLSMAQAVEILRQWPAAHRLDDLVLDEVEAYTENFYGQFKERETGRGAGQVLVDRYTGRAMPEMGPNMMWNTKYGMMGGMGMTSGTGMGGNMMNGGMDGMGMPGMMGQPAPPGGTTSGTQISEAQARQNANRFLSGYFPGAMAGDADSFYGYYHFDVMRGGRQVGMLSVNAGSGQVWYHTWHGEFIEKREIGR